LQLLFVVVGIALGMLLTRIRSGAMVATNRAIEVLGAVGFGIIGLVSVIFSLLFLVVQSSNTSFTPRLNLFQDDPWIWRTYAIALGLFAFSMSAFLAVGDVNRVSVIVPIFAFATALAVIGLIRRILTSAFGALQLNTVIDRVFKSGRTVIRHLYPQPIPATALETDSQPAPGPDSRQVIWTSPQATLQQLDLRQLMNAAEHTNSLVIFHTQVGATLREGSTIATVCGDLADDTVQASCVTGVNRTFNQDPLLAFRLLADIGLRALSPAVNDPATATQTLDAIIGLLSLLASQDLAIGSIASPDGAIRVRLAMPTWNDFVCEGLDELLAAANASPMMLTRAITTLSQLAEVTPPTRRPDLEARLQSVRRQAPRS
jgi:uncharacterized membrane protein